MPSSPLATLLCQLEALNDSAIFVIIARDDEEKSIGDQYFILIPPNRIANKAKYSLILSGFICKDIFVKI